VVVKVSLHTEVYLLLYTVEIEYLNYKNNLHKINLSTHKIKIKFSNQ
jgi:hypothetical protein